MKKLLAVILVLMCLGTALFADDAKTMPKKVGRLWLAPTFLFAPGDYDDSGEYDAYDDGEGSLKGLNFGFALEYGVIDWITAAVQWAPGWTAWSDVDMDLADLSSTSKVNANGLADLFVGAKIQIVGEKAPIQSSNIRLAFGPGVKIPLPGQDFKEQFENAQKNDDVTGANNDYHVLGAGARVYFDYVLNENFFINLYNETLFYPLKSDIENSSLNDYATFYGAKGQLATTYLNPAIMNGEAEVGYGYDLTFELEPIFSADIAEGVTFSAGLPVNYKFTPARTFSVTKAAGFESAIEDALEKEAHDAKTLSLKPNFGFFFTKFIAPTEVNFTYQVPVWGENVAARHSATLKVKIYFQIP
jgi:hypothetical protein